MGAVLAVVAFVLLLRLLHPPTPVVRGGPPANAEALAP